MLLGLIVSSALAAPPLSKKPPPPLPQVTGVMDFGSVSALHRAIQAWEKAAPPKKQQTEGPLLEEEGIDLLEAALAHLEPRAFPGDRVDWPRIQAAALARDALPPAAWTVDGKPARWQFIGPQDLPVPYRIYFGQGAINGRVNAVAFDPTEPRTYWLGSAGGGVWRSKDGGATWQPLTDAWPMLQVSALALIGRNTVIAGTGDFPYPAVAPAMGLMRSDDGGATWRRWGPPELEHYAISRILVDPDDANVITVSSGRGMRQWGAVWRTADGGKTWAKAIADPAAWCALSAGAKGTGGRRWYWAIGYEASGHRRVMRSADRGATWTEAHRAGPHTFLNLCSIAASPTDPETAWVLLGGLQKVLVTRDGGASFQDVTRDIPGGYNWAQDWYDLWLTVTSTRKGGRTRDSVYAGLIDVVQMTDGAGWRSIGRTYTPGALTHNDQQGVAVDPRDPASLLLGSDGGAYHLRHDERRDVHTFTSLNAKLGVTQFYRGAAHPTDPGIVLAGTQDNATPACLDGKKWTNVGGGDGAFCAINPKQPDIQYASSQFLYIYRTANRWRTSAMISPDWGSDRRAFIAPFALDPTDTGRLYAGTNHLWRWDDPQRRWTPRLGSQKLSEGGVVNAIAVAPADSRRLYTGSSMGEVWTSGDGGTAWARIDTAPGGFPRRTVTSIAVHPKRPQDVLVTLSGTGAAHVWRCADVTRPEWANVSAKLPDAPANCVIRDPAHPDRSWIVANDVGVFGTEDGGQTWKDATGPLGLPGVHVNDLLLGPQQRTLTAVTFGRGLWRIPLPR